mgnify:CR=1 FL=1
MHALTLIIITWVGTVLGGAVHGMVVLFAYVRIKDLSLTQLAKQHIADNTLLQPAPK